MARCLLWQMTSGTSTNPGPVEMVSVIVALGAARFGL